LVFILASSLVGAADLKDWTLIVFINADNNLDQFGVKDQQEMAKVGSNDALNIVTLIDREKSGATLNHIEKNNIVTIKDLGEVDMGDYVFFANSIKEMIAAYPAKHYAVVIWNHGSGWKNKNNGATKGISYDDSSGNHITTEQLGLAMLEIKKALGKNLDVLCMDACLMQMLEVAYVVKDSCDFMVASEETEPGDGYPYDAILSKFKKDTSPTEFCKNTVDAYAASYNNGSQGNSASTQSAIKCANLPALKDAIDGFAKMSIAGQYGQQYKDALTRVQKFYYKTNIDLAHLVELLNQSITDDSFKTASNKLESAIKATIIANQATGATMKNARGLAIYFPTSSYSFAQEYSKLAFAQETMWDEMLFDFYKKTSVQTVVSDISHGDTTSLIEYVKNSNKNPQEINAILITTINFALYVEKNIPQQIYQTVIQEMNKSKK
jgi:hypothetical protein